MFAGHKLYGVIVMAKRNDNEIIGMQLRPLVILQGFILSQLLLFLVSIILASLVYFSSWQAGNGLLSILGNLGVFGGAIWAGCRCYKRAWLHGIAVGILAFSILSFVGHGGPLLMTWLWWKGLLKMGFVAMLGGILGGLFSR